MAIRIDTDLQAVYVYEPDGHTVPALNTALSAGGRLRIEATEGLDSLVCGFFGDLAATNYWGLFASASGTNVQLRGRQGGTTTTSGNYALPPGEYNLSIEHDAGTLRARLDGVVILSLAYAPDAGTPGDRSFQIGGYGEVSGFIDCTIARWRMWSGVLTEAEWRREFRSTVPARTRGLLHDWPMEAGSGRFNDTVGSEPDLIDNPLVPCGDGSEIYLRATPLGTPQFFSLGETATPGALSVTVPRWADRVVVHVAWSSNSVATFNVASISGNFCGTFVATENEDNLTTSVGVAVFHAEVQITGTGRSLTIALDAGSSLAGANCWVSFMQDVDRSSPVSAMDTGHAGTGGTVPGTTSVSVVAPAMVVALDARLSTTSGGYATNESGWTSIGTNETTGAIGYWLCSRLRQYAADSGPVSATTQDTFASAIVSIAFQSAAMATAAPTAPLPLESNVVESGNNTASTSWAVSHPAAVAGDMLLFHLAWDDSTTVSTVTAPSGPNGETATVIAGPVASNSTEIRIEAWRYIATGSWSASTRTFTPAASEQWTAAVLKIPAGEFDASTPIGAASTAASAGVAETAVLSPAYSLGSTDGGGRLISFLAADDDPFTGFAAHWSTHSNVDRGAVAGLLASRDFETTNSESAAAGTWNIAGDSWASLAYVVRKAADAGVTGTLAVTESGSDTIASSGTVLVEGALTATETGSDTAALAGTVLVEGDLAATESGSDTAVIQGGAVATGDLDATETGSDTASLAGTVLVEGALSVSEVGSDTAAISGAVLVQGTLSVTEAGSDTAAISGLVLVQGALTVTESGSDTFAASGSLSGGINGSLNASESGSDTFASTGDVVVTGSLAAAESGSDTAALSGVVVVQGSLVVTETGSDTFNAEGSASIRTGTMDAVESGSDTAEILGDGISPATGSPHGFVITDTAPKLWWKRKPKALDEEEAEQKVSQVVRVVERIALRQVEAQQPAPAKELKREVREAIGPLVAEMPGFDWMTLYRTILIELGRRQQEQQAAELAQIEIARIQAMSRDEDDVLILLMSL
ncbi:MAG: hypothetical protein KIT86_00700 [Hydrogenophaga sp.]|uniref:hypothetical protein n=1 Tax=Hydrogenophaga sp. TaxID=1904254 RepID=UPI0026375E81|nr:hypothetical protein [Hydrogenophaga sp.]MCW5668145.1 hypothetical protein [Hydrogenophaga sp.]